MCSSDLLFGVLPSLIWLAFYLRKDAHPESNRMILKIFFYGMLIALPAIFLELGILSILKDFNIPFIVYIFLGIALTEESLKYLVIHEKVLSNPEFDEPVDAILYMIIAALGFAAAENILILSGLGNSPLLEEIFAISALRFVGATFLHALVSGIVGYFLALSFFDPEGQVYGAKNKKRLVFWGLLIAIFLHGLYNLSIIEIVGPQRFIIPIAILSFSAIFISSGFKKLKRNI